jgi:hypothetical protein
VIVGKVRREAEVESRGRRVSIGCMKTLFQRDAYSWCNFTLSSDGSKGLSSVSHSGLNEVPW